MKEWPYRHPWWVLCATYAAVLFVQRNNLSDPTIATLFLVVGGLLLAWGFDYAKAVAADASARRSAAAIAGVIAMVVIAAALVVGKWSSVPDYETDSGTSEAPPSAPATIVEPYGSEPRPDLPQTPISPAALLAEFQENHFSAYEKYRGRLVQVVGDVAEVGGGPNEGAYLLLSVPDREHMQARFPINPDQIKGVKQGFHVVLSCAVRYDADLDNAILSDCSLVK